MPEFHAEPYIYLPGLTHKSALVAWGAFYFRTRTDGRWKLIDDQHLRHVHPPRCDSIGAKSKPYGRAEVRVYDAGGTQVSCAETVECNHCWVAGLEPDTEYTYKVFVNEEEWAAGERWDWESTDRRGLVQKGLRYDNRFRTFPHPDEPAPTLTFAAIGDFGTGIRKSTPKRRQKEVADALNRAVDSENIRLILTTGDNIYAGSRFLGLIATETGDEDDDWFFTYFQPYRYTINRIPVFPSIGNHDTGETEEHDDRGQVEDNFYLKERLVGEDRAGRASFGPGLFYRFRFGSTIEFICIDTSREGFFSGRLFDHPNHEKFVEQALPDLGDRAPDLWRIPFSHHPWYCAGPQHHNTRQMARLVPLLQRAGVRVAFSGHEHNFQHSHVDGITYIVSGAGSKKRTRSPDGFRDAHTVSWAPECHFVVARIDGRQMTIQAIGELPASGELREVARLDPQFRPVTAPITVRL